MTSAYIAERIVRNGTTVAVTEAQDFAAIIQRRLFENAGKPLAAGELARAYTMAANTNWRDKVLEKLGPNRTLTGFGERVEASYPFHPELMRLVQQEWSQVQNFQRVRSTVAIFARTVLYWVNEHAAGRWAPARYLRPRTHPERGRAVFLQEPVLPARSIDRRHPPCHL
jgi:predicted AAA+ superfamily ATPase